MRQLGNLYAGHRDRRDLEGCHRALLEFGRSIVGIERLPPCARAVALDLASREVAHALVRQSAVMSEWLVDDDELAA